MSRSVNGVFIGSGDTEHKPFCMRCRRNMHDYDGTWACSNCGKRFRDDEDEHVLVVDTYDPLLTNNGIKPPPPADFPTGSKVLNDKEINSETGDEKELEYD